MFFIRAVRAAEYSFLYFNMNGLFLHYNVINSVYLNNVFLVPRGNISTIVVFPHF